MSLQVRREDFASLSAEWEELNRHSGGGVFATPAWLGAWWSSCASAEELHLLSVRGGGELIGVAPLMRSGDAITFVGRSDVCDHHEITMASGRERPVLQALVEHLDTLDWSSLRLEGIPEGSATLEGLPPAASERGWKVEEPFDEESPSRSLNGDWDAYLSGLPKKDRHEIRRKLRRLMSAGEVRVYDAAQESGLDDAMPLFLDLARKSNEDKADFLTEDRERFFLTLADTMQAKGWLKLFFLEIDGVTAAASLCFDYGGAYYLYNSGYEPRFASLSVGVMLKALALKDAIEAGREVFHFLRGAEPYKFDLGGGSGRLMKLLVSR